MKLENQYKYKTPDLCKLLGVTRMTLYNWEQQGIFSPPRNLAGDRVFTEVQLKEISKAFSPSGKHKWIFSE